MIPAIAGAIGPLGPGEWGVGGVGGVGQTAGVGPTAGIEAGLGGAAPVSGAGSFGDTLTNALNSLEATQATATTASQQLATGQLTDPTQAVTAVENASLAMDLASQFRNKLDEVATTIFQTQV